MALLHGALVVNSFLESRKFSEIYELLNAAAGRNGVELNIKKTFEAVGAVGEKPSALSDFVLFWDKDVFAARQLESYGVPVFNSAEAIEICDNKALTALKLAEHKINMPKTVISDKTFEGVGITDFAFLERAAAAIGFPMVIKEAYGSFGKQVYLAEDFAAAKRIIEKITPKDFIMQEFIASSAGRDIRINIVGGKAVASMLRQSVGGDFRSNISNGGTMSAFSPSDEQISIAVKACEAIGADFAGVDVLFGSNGEPLICEVNSNPHFASTLECTGVNLADSIIKLIIDRSKKCTAG